MKTRYMADLEHFSRMTTAETRKYFLIDDLFVPDQTILHYCETDRAIAGSAVPIKGELDLPAGDNLRADHFCQRREVGIVNIGGAGAVRADGKRYDLRNRDALYLGRGVKDVKFLPGSAENPARYYILSYPAHASYPTALVRQAEAATFELGSPEQANARTLRRYIHADGPASCQLVMGVTTIKSGSVWNTMPPHTHLRRMEVYLYFDLDKGAKVFHLMGSKTETRHIVTGEREAIMSPMWSLHSGCGTGAYSFIWGMGGENQTFDDMDPISMDELR